MPIFTYNPILWVAMGTGQERANIGGVNVAILTAHTFDADYTLTMLCPFTGTATNVANKTQAETVIEAALNSALNAVVDTCV